MDLSRKSKFDAQEDCESCTVEAEILLHQLHATLKSSLKPKYLTNNYEDIYPFPPTVSEIVDLEMKDIKSIYDTEEKQYVEQKIIEDPPIVAARKRPVDDKEKNDVQKQKAEACRKSRMRAKVKNMQLKLKHQFIKNKINKSTKVLQCIYDVIDHAELKLIQGGCNQNELNKLKKSLAIKKIFLK